MAITTFIPQLWAARLIENYRKSAVVVNLFNRNYEGEIKQMGDTVHINSLQAITVKDYTANEAIADPEQLTTDDHVLNIDHGKYFNFYLDDVDAVQARGDLMDAAMRDAAYRILDDHETYAMEKLLEGATSVSAPGTVTAQTAPSAVLLLKTAMDNKNVPRGGRKLIVAPQFEAFLLSNQIFISGTKGEERLENGFVGRAFGFDIYSSTTVGTNLVAMRSEDATFAEQINKMEAYRPDNRFADAVKGLALCGAKVTNPDGVFKMALGS